MYNKGNISTGWIIFIVLVVLVGGYFLVQGTSQDIPEDPTENATSTQSETMDEEMTDDSQDMNDSSNESEESENIITYDGSSFSPSSITIPQGSSVTFVNASESQGMWVASALHPNHEAYPTTGGCLGSTFDACDEIAPGEDWTFTFDEAGEWGYHNHVKPGDTGAVIVE